MRKYAKLIPCLGCGTSKILESNDNHLGYPSSNIFIYSCDDQMTEHSVGVVTWWLAPPGQTGADAELIVELGCETLVDAVVLMNSPNGMKNDR